MLLKEVLWEGDKYFEKPARYVRWGRRKIIKIYIYISELPKINLEICRTIPWSFVKHMVIYSCLIRKLLVDNLSDLERHSKKGRTWKESSESSKWISEELPVLLKHFDHKFPPGLPPETIHFTSEMIIGIINICFISLQKIRSNKL